MRWKHEYTTWDGWEQVHVWAADNGARIVLYPPRLRSGFVHGPNQTFTPTFVIYADGQVAWDGPERVAKYIREKTARIAGALAAGAKPEDL